MKNVGKCNGHLGKDGPSSATDEMGPTKNGIVATSSKNKGRKRKRSIKTEDVYPENYEVERIVAHEVYFGRVTKYFVKWKGYPSETNTWEPFENVRDCLESIANYFHDLIYPGMSKNHYASKIAALKTHLTQFTDLEITNGARTYFTDDGDKIPSVDVEEVDNLVTLLAQIPPSGQDPKFKNEIKMSYLYKELKIQRDKQMKDLKQWEKDIQAVCSDKAPIKVLNSVDLEGPPLNFSYVNSYVPGPDVVIPLEPPFGCECTSLCGQKSCSNIHNGLISYSNQGILRVSRGTPIYECNKTCKCGSDCPNRVVQRGRTIPVAIFRTNNGCGWGLRTLSKIQKGQFVVEYVGEVITNEEAERRGRSYDKQGCTYLFDLDFNEKENFPYTVDAAVYGNVSHFINHSCNPNLEVFAVWINCLDPNMPRLGLFATRSIKENEELTFDYLCQPAKDLKINDKASNRSNSFSVNNSKKAINNDNSKMDIREENACKCGAHNCRKFLFFN